MPIRVVLVDDHRVVAEAIAARLRLEPDILTVLTRYDAAGARDAVRDFQPDAAIVDLELGRDDGLLLLEELREVRPGLRTIVLTAHDDPERATDAVRAGASAFVSKDSATDDLVTILRGVLDGESYIPPRLLTGVLQYLQSPGFQGRWQERIARLTPRERQVLQHMMAGEDRPTIARELYLSVNTIRTHAKHILAKLEVHSTLEAVGLALQAGLQPAQERGSQ